MNPTVKAIVRIRVLVVVVMVMVLMRKIAMFIILADLACTTIAGHSLC